jgi:hypothetical protein
MVVVICHVDGPVWLRMKYVLSSQSDSPTIKFCENLFRREFIYTAGTEGHIFIFVSSLKAKMMCVKNWYVWDRNQRIEACMGRGCNSVQVLGLGLPLTCDYAEDFEG